MLPQGCKLSPVVFSLIKYDTLNPFKTWGNDAPKQYNNVSIYHNCHEVLGTLLLFYECVIRLNLGIYWFAHNTEMTVNNVTWLQDSYFYKTLSQ